MFIKKKKKKKINNKYLKYIYELFNTIYDRKLENFGHFIPMLRLRQPWETSTFHL